MADVSNNTSSYYTGRIYSFYSKKTNYGNNGDLKNG